MVDKKALLILALLTGALTHEEAIAADQPDACGGHKPPVAVIYIDGRPA